MRRLALTGLLMALPFVAVPLVWAATGGGGRDGACAVDERADRLGIAAGEPSVAPVRWDAYAHAVSAGRLTHNLRHGGIAVQYGARVPERTVRRLVVWYRRDPVAVVVAPLPELGDKVVLSSWSSRARCHTFDEPAFSAFRAEQRFRGPESRPRAELEPARTVESLRASPRLIAFVVSEAAGLSVAVRDTQGRLVRRLGHFTVPARQRLVLVWNARDETGKRLPLGRYVAVIEPTGSDGESFRAPFEVG